MNDTPITDKHEFPVMTWNPQDNPLVVRSTIARQLERELSEAQRKTCEWSCGDPDWNLWNTCADEWQLMEGSPTENKMKFCPFCGGTIIEIPYEEEP